MKLIIRLISALSILFYLFVSNSVQIHSHDHDNTHACHQHDAQHEHDDHSDCAVCFFQLVPQATPLVFNYELPQIYTFTYFEFTYSFTTTLKESFLEKIANKGPPTLV